jgi:hypothetical protein
MDEYPLPAAPSQAFAMQFLFAFCQRHSGAQGISVHYYVKKPALQPTPEVNIA